MTVSTRARLARLAVTRFRLSPEVDLGERRRAFDRVDRVPRPRRLEYRDTKVGGRPAIVAAPVGADRERHVLYLHGGGYMLGSPRSHIGLAARLARRAGASVTVIDYRLAPEHPYPAAIDDCLAAYRAELVTHAPAQLVLAGDSAGGNAVLSTLVAARDAGHPMPACAYLLSPWTDLTCSGESMRTKVDVDPMLDPRFIASAALAYAGARPVDEPGLSPLFADLSGLPPLLVQCGTDEVLLDDSVRLAERARSAGVEVSLEIRGGMWHVYQAFAPYVPEATEALIEAAMFIRARSPAGGAAATAA